MQDERHQRQTTSVKATETVKKVRSLVKAMYKRALDAKATGQPVAYTMTGCQYDELLVAMDIVPIWTENYAGLCAAKRDAERFILKAEAKGYSNVICGYVRTGIGYDATRQELGGIPLNSPDGGMAMPDLLLGCSAFCDPRFKWYQALGHFMDVPTYAYDVVVPPINADINVVRDYYVRYQYEEFKGLLKFLEEHTKKKLDQNRLWETIKLADESWAKWYELDRLRRAIPGPMPSEDHYNAMVPAHYYCGTPEALTFYQELRDEVKYRADNRIGVIANEKYRLLFGGGLPPWHTMWIFNYFESLGAVFVIENAYRVYDPVEVPFAVRDPLEYLAWRTFLRMTQRFCEAQQPRRRLDGTMKKTGSPWVERLLEFIEDYKIDGVIFHATRSCRATTSGQLHWMNLLKEYVKIPSLQLVSDIVDVRDYSEAQWKGQINAFVEAVDARKQRQKK